METTQTFRNWEHETIVGQQEDGKFGAVKDDKYVENVAMQENVNTKLCHVKKRQPAPAKKHRFMLMKIRSGMV